MKWLASEQLFENKRIGPYSIELKKMFIYSLPHTSIKIDNLNVHCILVNSCRKIESLHFIYLPVEKSFGEKWSNREIDGDFSFTLSRRPNCKMAKSIFLTKNCSKWCKNAFGKPFWGSVQMDSWLGHIQSQAPLPYLTSQFISPQCTRS